MPTAERLALHLQHLAEQRLGLVVLALVPQIRSECIQGPDCGLPVRALGLEPCALKSSRLAQCIAVPVPALAAAV